MTLTPYYSNRGITIYCGDCLDVMPQLEPGVVNAVIADPPYGMDNDTDYTRFSGGHRDSVNKRGQGKDYGGPIANDDKPFDPTPFLSFGKVLMWGANHYGERLPVGTTLVWIKRNDDAFGSFLSDAEIGWMKGGYGVYCIRDLSMNAIALKRCHPNQKPVSLMKWCINLATCPRDVILDPYMGSGTTLVAAQNEGRRAIGIELSEEYCAIAVDRLRQPSFFSLPVEPKANGQAKQIALLGEP